MIKSHTFKKDFENIVQELVQSQRGYKINVLEFAQHTGIDRRKVAAVLKGQAYHIDVLENLLAIYQNKSLVLSTENFRLPSA